MEFQGVITTAIKALLSVRGELQAKPKTLPLGLQIEKLLRGHRLKLWQLVAGVPELRRLVALQCVDAQTLARNLNSEMVEGIAREFRINAAWLYEQKNEYDNLIVDPYGRIHCYKQMKTVEQRLKTAGWSQEDIELHLIACDAQTVCEMRRYMIVFSRPIETKMKGCILREALIVDNVWDAHHGPGWSDTLLLARWFIEVRSLRKIPVVSLAKLEFEQLLRNERLVVEFLDWSPTWRFEDFVLAKSESECAKSVDKLSDIIAESQSIIGDRLTEPTRWAAQ